MNAKAELRKQAQQRRAALFNADFAPTIAGHIGALRIEPGAVVSGYWAFRDEADPRVLMLALAARGHPLCLPVILGKGRPLRFHRWRASDAMRVHAFGVTEPQPDAEILTPSVLLVPLLAFDAVGYRLGYGGGFYDRTLEGLRAAGTIQAVGIAFAGQEVPAVPHDDHDQRLDAVLTERGLRRL